MGNGGVYEGEVPGTVQCVKKKAGQFKVKCLTEPYPTGGVHRFEERKSDTIYYESVFKAPVIPYRSLGDDNGKTILRKTLNKYDMKTL